MKEAFKGNNELVDLSVGDIYGGSYSSVGLDSSLIASSFSKINISDKNLIENKDMGKALAIFYGVTYSRISTMLASKENINKMIISGDTFDSLELMQMIECSIDTYSGNTIDTIFCDYSNFLAIIGMVVELNNDGMI
jgi:type II pantothenate kinase